MKRSFFCSLVLALAVAFGGTGCKHSGKGLTPIPNSKAAPVTPTTPISATPQVPRGTGLPGDTNVPGGNPLADPDADKLKNGENGIKAGDIEKFQDRPVDKSVFTQYTVYFEFDRSTVRESEKSKLEAVADYMKKASADKDLLVEGHCDERGTEEYNRALGERRAQALREYLVNLGLSASRIQTVSYGKDKPLDPEHNDTAWSKNRRGEFGLLLPKP
jgi:peptidoglycan-associated lipoprotein